MKKISIFLTILILFTSLAFAEDTIEFEPIEKIQSSPLYTPILVDGYDYPIYAYEHEDGVTRFRIYGKMGRKTGYYEASITTDGDNLVVETISDTPRKDARTSAAIASLAKRGTFEIPENWTYTYNNGNYLQFEDIFGKTQLFLASKYREGETLLLPCNKKGEPIPGSLGIVPESYANLLKDKPYNMLLPKNCKKGFQTEVYILTTDGEQRKVKTAYPELDVDTLEISGKLPRMRVRMGTQNANILGLQKMLADLGYYGGEIDGVFGEGCITAIEMFQEQNGLRATGKPDERTMKTLIFGDPVANDKPIKKSDFKENAVGGDSYKDSYLDNLGN